MSSPAEEARRLVETSLDARDRPAISCSFQLGGLALLHLMGERRREIPVLFVDTGYHFQETLEFMHRITEMWGLDLRVLSVAQEVRAQEKTVGQLYRTNPDLCCQTRKTDPLFRALADHDLWLTGLRRDQSASRRDTGHHERRLLPSGSVIEKLNPIVDWTDADLRAFTTIHEIPTHPMMDQGYPSIGCAPCTSMAAGDSQRSGRWQGGKVECGLHTHLEPAHTE